MPTILLKFGDTFMRLLPLAICEMLVIPLPSPTKEPLKEPVICEPLIILAVIEFITFNDVLITTDEVDTDNWSIPSTVSANTL